MDPEILVLAFMLGFASTVHCLGMCGGIAGALGLSLPEAVRGRKAVLLGYAAAYNGGRIVSYAVAGTIAGLFGAGVFEGLTLTTGNLLLRVVAGGGLVLVGLYLGGWFPSFGRLEAVGIPLWRKIEPLGRKLLPVRSPFAALLYGGVWGWLPCGLVYSALLWAASSGSPRDGGLILVMFGAGTLPVMISSTVFSRWIADRLRRGRVRRAIGVAMILAGIVSVLYAGGLEADCGTCGAPVRSSI